MTSPYFSKFFPKGFLAGTNGRGLWSNHVTTVRIVDWRIDMWFPEEDEDPDLAGADLQLKFDRETWSVRKHGLIYTDRRFEQDVRKAFGS